MSKFSEMLILVCRKIFSALYTILHETFSNSYSFPHMQGFNSLHPHLVLYHRKHFCNLDWFEQIFIFVSSKVPSAKLWCKECSHKTVSKNVEAAVRKCSSEAVAQRCSVKKMFLKVLQNSQKNTHARISSLIKLQARNSTCNFIKKRLWHRCFPVNFVKFLRTPFLIEHLRWLLLVLQGRCS